MIAVAYLLRGKDMNWQECCNRFLYSYQQFVAGCDHELHVIIKGFEREEDEISECKKDLEDIKQRKILHQNSCYAP